jgi:hypothetical protein
MNEKDKETLKPALPITMPLLACSAMQACYVMIMTLYRVKFALLPDQALTGSLNSPNDTSFPETERLVEELRHGVKDSLQILERYQEEFAHVKAMYDELKGVYKVAFADV